MKTKTEQKVNKKTISLARKKRRRKKILIIEDNLLIGKMWTRPLIKAGYQEKNVFCASNGMEGIDKFHETKPDLVTIDTIMPGMDGFSVCEIITESQKAKDNQAKVIIVGDFLDEEKEKQRAKKAGALGYYSKSNTSPTGFAGIIDQLFGINKEDELKLVECEEYYVEFIGDQIKEVDTEIGEWEERKTQLEAEIKICVLETKKLRKKKNKLSKKIDK